MSAKAEAIGDNGSEAAQPIIFHPGLRTQTMFLALQLRHGSSQQMTILPMIWELTRRCLYDEMQVTLGLLSMRLSNKADDLLKK